MKWLRTLTEAGAAADQLPSLLLQAEKIAHSLRRGTHGRRRTGAGETFWQFRDYQPGDARRDIDWRQTAKRDAPFVRQTEWEAAQTLWLYRSAAPSMDFTSDEKFPPKKTYAELILLALAIVALEGGEQVGLLGTALMPQAHASAAARLFQHLPDQSGLSSQLKPVGRHAEIVLIADFYAPVQETAAAVAALAGRETRGILLQVCDPAEETLPYRGRVRFEEEKDSLLLPNVETVRAEYLARFQSHRAAIADIAQKHGWRFLSVRTDEPPVAVLTKLYDMMSGGAG